MTNQALVGHLPVLVHPAPKHALVIGLAARHRGSRRSPHARVDRPDRAVRPRCSRSATAVSNRSTAASWHDPRVHVRIEDGRNFVAFRRRRALRRHRQRAEQSVDDRRLEPLHRRVLRAAPSPPPSRRRPGAVVPLLQQWTRPS
jgi:hypothetical protein